MSHINVTVLDEARAIHGQPHGSSVDILVAALSAEPETIEELEAAIKRFVEPGNDKPLAGWRPGIGEEPYDAGICIIDLAARLVVIDSTYSLPGPRGEVLFRDTDRDIEASIPYHVSSDWQFIYEIECWEERAKSRRLERQSVPRLDTRQVLYDRVAEFIVTECFAARGSISPTDAWTPPDGWSLQVLSERAKADEPIQSDDAVAEIHARWLMTPRDDLGGRFPRDVLLEKRDHLSWDLQDRSNQWSFLGNCPPPLSQESAAFRFGGFGTHENVLYYDLVRHLVWECWRRVVEPIADAAKPTIHAPSTESPTEVLAWLQQAQDEWLNEPNWEDLLGRVPAAVIGCERQRIPMACTGTEAMVEDDCPLCQMLADSSQPTFWNLDGCNMDDDFPFAIYHRTREEWEEERREYEEFSRKCDEERREREARSKNASPPIWKRSMANPDAGDSSPSLRIFGIGCRVAELGEDLKERPETQPLVESLNRQFGNLRAALEEPSASLLAPVVERFCQELGAVAEARADLAEKCADLERQLREFAVDVLGDEDMPF